MKITNIFCSLLIGLLVINTKAYSQKGREVITNHRFLLASPDARAAAMGNAGGALSPDANAIFWNPAKIVFNTSKLGATAGYIPWSNEYSDNRYQINAAGYYKLNEKEAIGISTRYHHDGKTTLYDIDGSSVWAMSDGYEMSFSVAYSRKINKRLSLGITGRLIHFEPNFSTSLRKTSSGTTPAVDVGLFYSKPVGKTWHWNTSVVLSNLGPKSYYYDDFPFFISGKINLSSALSTQLGKNHKVTWAAEISKLLAPSPTNPFKTGSFLAKVPWREGVLGSFNDADDGFREEFHEIIWSTGFEYQFKNTLSLRTGYHFEHRDKGNRSDLTVGVGVKLGKLRLDTSYLFQLNDTNAPFLINGVLTTPADKFRTTVSFEF